MNSLYESIKEYGNAKYQVTITKYPAIVLINMSIRYTSSVIFIIESIPNNPAIVYTIMYITAINKLNNKKMKKFLYKGFIVCGIKLKIILILKSPLVVKLSAKARKI